MSNKDTSRFIPTELSNRVKSIVVRPIDYQRVDVAVRFGDGLELFVQEYVDAVVLRYQQQGADYMPFALDDFRRYVKTLIVSRIRWVNRDRDVVLHYSDPVMVPAFLNFVLSGLGRVEIPELGIELTPVVDPLMIEDIMTREEALEFSTKLRVLAHGDMGFVLADGYARDKTGAFDLMVMQLIEGQVLSHTDKGHPAYAVAAYFLGLMQMTQLLGPRLLYGTREQMRMILRVVAAE